MSRCKLRFRSKADVGLKVAIAWGTKSRKERIDFAYVAWSLACVARSKCVAQLLWCRNFVVSKHGERKEQAGGREIFMRRLKEEVRLELPLAPAS